MCAERNWSVYKLSLEANVSSNTVYKWFKTKSSPTLHVLNAICEALGTTIITFLLDDDDYPGLSNEQIKLLDIYGKLPESARKAQLEYLENLLNTYKE